MKMLRIGLCGLTIASLVAGGFVFSLPQAQAAGSASLYVAPSSGTLTVGSTFTVSIYLNTGGNFVNAIEANLSFPPDKLQVVSPTAGKSIVQIWLNQPNFSNSEGILRFQGAIPRPGINAEAGVISTITFRVRETGTAIVKFLDTSKVLLSDGKGTDVLGQKTDGLYYLTLPPPAGPTVTSPSHPDQEKWYANNTAVLRWNINSVASGYSFILNENPVDIPDDISDGFRDSVVYRDLPDGDHYFHIKSFRNGFWGGVTSYALKTDTTPPAAFKPEISPSSYTSSRKPAISFETTDGTSGIDHYEVKFIPLDPPPSGVLEREETQFFIEVSSPYSRTLDIGRYDVVVKAYDEAGNVYQAVERLTIASPLFEIVRGKGLRVIGAYVIPWIYAWALLIVLLFVLSRAAKVLWMWHRQVERELETGAHKHPLIVEKFEALREKLKEYGRHPPGKHLMLLLVVAVGVALMGFPSARVAAQLTGSRLEVEPPVVTLFPKSISNDEIFYIGGRAGAPNAQVIIYFQQVETGSTLSQTTISEKTGEWFYTLPQFLNAGNYLVWTQLKIGDAVSPPSSRLDLSVAPTAIQLGKNRLSYQDLYLILFLVFGVVSLGLSGFIVYHFYHFNRKNWKLRKEVQEAEESLRRGFSMLRNDIEAELVLVRKAKMTRELRTEEKFREEKLLKDLDAVGKYLSKEIWEIEQAEKEL